KAGESLAGRAAVDRPRRPILRRLVERPNGFLHPELGELEAAGVLQAAAAELETAIANGQIAAQRDRECGREAQSREQRGSALAGELRLGGAAVHCSVCLLRSTT